MHRQRVVPVAITSKYLVPTRSAGPVVLSHVADGGVELATELQADQGMIKQTRSRERLMETDVRLWDESSVWDESPKRD